MTCLHRICDTERLQLRMEDIGKSDYPAHLQSYMTDLLHCWVANRACHIRDERVVIH